MVAAAVGIGSAVAGVAGSSLSSSASKSAAGTEANAANNATQLQQNMFNTSQQNFAPYLQSGQDANAKLSYLLGIGSPSGGGVAKDESNFDSQAYLAANPDVAAYIAANPGQTNAWQHYQDFGQNEGRAFTYNAGAQQQLDAAKAQAASGGGADTPGGFGSLTGSFTPADYLANKDPGYDFQQQQGQQALQNSAAAGSGSASGAALKGLLSYSQGLAATGYNDAFNRFQTGNQNIYNRLAGIVGNGQASAAGSAANATSAGANIANTSTSAANAIASGTIGSANAINGGINNATQSLLLSQLLAKNNSAGASTLGGD